MRLHFSYDVSQDELGSVSDAIYEAFRREPSNDQVEDIIRALPLTIIGSAMSFGFGDTEVRGEIYQYLKSEYNIMWDKTAVIVKAYDLDNQTTEIVGASTITKCVEFGIPIEVIFEQEFEVFLSREDATALMRF